MLTAGEILDVPFVVCLWRGVAVPGSEAWEKCYNFMTTLCQKPLYISVYWLVKVRLVLRSILDTASIVRPAGNAVVLVASERRLLRAARAEGLQTFNPEVDTQAYLD